MRIITDIERIDREAWRALAAASPVSTWFQTAEAYDFFTAQPELFAPFVVAIADDSSVLQAVCVGYVTVEKNAVKQMLTRRAIIIGGPLLSENASDEVVKALLRALKQMLHSRAIYIETRNLNDYSRWRSAFEQCGFAYHPHLNFHVDTSTIEVVEHNLGKSRKRDIRTSLRDGAYIIEQPTIEQVRDYYAILQHLYRTRVKTPLFPLSFFETLYANRDGRFILIGKKKSTESTLLSDQHCPAPSDMDIEILGGTVCVAQADKCLYEWFAAGRDGEWKSIFPSCVATYAGICYAAEHGLPRFDMMGAGRPDEAYGVRDFKAKFGGQQVEHGRFLHICKPLLYKIGVLGVKILKRKK